MVISRTVEFERAEEREHQGDWLAASELYLRSGFSRLAESGLHDLEETNDVSCSNRHLAIGELLRALLCALRGGNRARAERLQPLLEEIIEIIREDVTDSTLNGLLHEWIGDSYLLVGSVNAEEHYSKARTSYESADESEHYFWGQEPEFDRAYWVFEDFVESKGFPSTDGGTPLQVDFDKRISYKLKLVDETERG